MTRLLLLVVLFSTVLASHKDDPETASPTFSPTSSPSSAPSLGSSTEELWCKAARIQSIYETSNEVESIFDFELLVTEAFDVGLLTDASTVNTLQGLLITEMIAQFCPERRLRTRHRMLQTSQSSLRGINIIDLKVVDDRCSAPLETDAASMDKDCFTLEMITKLYFDERFIMNGQAITQNLREIVLDAFRDPAWLEQGGQILKVDFPQAEDDNGKGSPRTNAQANQDTSSSTEKSRNTSAIVLPILLVLFAIAAIAFFVIPNVAARKRDADMDDGDALVGKGSRDSVDVGDITIDLASSSDMSSPRAEIILKDSSRSENKKKQNRSARSITPTKISFVEAPSVAFIREQMSGIANDDESEFGTRRYADPTAYRYSVQVISDTQNF